MREVLIGDGAQRQAREIHLVGAAEMEQQVQGADERLDPDGDAGVGGLTLGGRPLGRCFLTGHLFSAGPRNGPRSLAAADNPRSGPRTPPAAEYPLRGPGNGPRTAPAADCTSVSWLELDGVAD